MKDQALNKIRENLDKLFDENDWQIKRGVLLACGDMLDETNCRPSPARAKALRELLKRVFGESDE